MSPLGDALACTLTIAGAALAARRELQCVHTSGQGRWYRFPYLASFTFGFSQQSASIRVEAAFIVLA